MLSVQLGPFAIPTSLALLYLGLICAWLLGWFIGRKRGANPEAALFHMLISGFIAARIAFVIRYWQLYGFDPLAIIDIRDGGFMPLVGILAALAVAAYYLWRKAELRIPLASGLTLGIIISGLGFALLQALLDSQKLPDMAMRDIQGHSVELHSYIGKPLVVNLWATWCPPCRREMPVLEAAQQQNPDIHFVFINQGEGQQLVEEFFIKQQLSLDNVLLDTGARMGQSVSSLSLPTTLFYDAEGLLQNNHLGELSNASLKHALRTINTQPEKESQ
ncbi:MAG: redoxin family protein [Gammaproteobacteria bacterium]|nr:redoxin family protein [Gammaproteobacteria bacterium]